METYKSEKQIIDCDVTTIYSKLSNPEVFKAQLDANIDNLPEAARDNLKNLKFDADGITIESPMGPLKMAVKERVENSKIVFGATQSPVAFNLIIELEALGEEQTQMVSALQIDLPFMLKAMVGGKLADGAKMFGQAIAKIPYKDL